MAEVAKVTAEAQSLFNKATLDWYAAIAALLIRNTFVGASGMFASARAAAKSDSICATTSPTLFLAGAAPILDFNMMATPSPLGS